MPHTHVIHQNNLNLQTAKTKHNFLFNTSSVSERVDIVSKNHNVVIQKIGSLCKTIF